jgi:hypothetical protein
MTATTHQATLQPQLSATVRFVAAVAVAGALAVAWTVAEQASHQAVQTATAAFSGNAGSPAVAVAVRREAARRS